MNKILILTAVIFLLLAGITLAVMATCYHRVLVVEGTSGMPLEGAYITLERSSGASAEAGRTDANGRLAFWSTPLPLPRLICASSTFLPPACVGANGLTPRRIELAVPAGTP
jgi:hypothetical protein